MRAQDISFYDWAVKRAFKDINLIVNLYSTERKIYLDAFKTVLYIATESVKHHFATQHSGKALPHLA